ncbi:MAG: amidohydrolase family protein [Candidatus Tyrphobacter sp.]
MARWWRALREIIRCARAVVGGALREDFGFVVDGGAIADAGDFASVRARHPGASVRAFPVDRLVVPGFINGHSHAYQILLRGWADDLPFQRWRDDALYRVIPQLEPEDVYWVFVAAFSEMLAAGITTVAEFFYLNGRGNRHAEAAIRAAQRTGIRLVMARTWMDAPQAPPAFRETLEEAAERTRELRDAFPHARVCVAPHSLHGASEAMIRCAAEFAREEGCDLHIHVAETSSEVALSRERYGAAPVVVLDRFGALSERSVVVHAIHVTESEKELLAERRVRVVRNPTTNLYLGDGLGDIVGLRSRGVCVGLGSDANVKPSAIDEMRAAAYEQKAATLDGSALGAGAAFALATSEGARAIGVAAGDLAAGQAADFVVLDASSIDPWSPPVNALVYRGEDAWVQACFVEGRRVYTGEASPIAQEARLEVAAIGRRLLSV